MRALPLASAALLASLAAACGPPAPLCPTFVTTPIPVAVPGPPAAAPPTPTERPRVAVLPLDDEELFRAERAALRSELAARLAVLAPDQEIVPLAEVDAKLRPVSRKTGHACAYAGVPLTRRAEDEGFAVTDILHVAGLPKEGRGEALWVTVGGRHRSTITFEAPWNSKLGRVDRYRAAFSALVRNDGGGLLGGLGAYSDFKGALQEGPLVICERKSFFQCDPASIDWKDRAAEVTACFSGEDDVTTDLLLQGDASGRYCEIQNLDAREGREGAREACVCNALGGSSAFGKRPGRREVRVHYEAPDLAGKSRPELRVIESSTNLHVEDGWHTLRRMVDGKNQYRSVKRLEVENLDALAAPLARCALPLGSVIVADLDIREDGNVQSGTIVTGAPDAEAKACLEKALARGAFECTDDGNNARVRVAIDWRP